MNTFRIGVFDLPRQQNPCTAQLRWVLSPTGTFAAWVFMFDANGAPIYAGDCVAEVKERTAGNAYVQRMLALVLRWRHNDQRRGSACQEHALSQCGPMTIEQAQAYLVFAGLDPCPDTGHHYGRGMVREPIPAGILHEIQDWPSTPSGDK
jgi:hypothetical protein